MRPLIFLLFLLSCSTWLLSQSAPFTVNVDVPLVTVDFTVKNSTGKLITDLNRYDFEVLDNGEPRDIQNFSPTRTPYNVLLLLDCSGSTRDRLNLLVSALARFADQLRTQDKAAVAVFGEKVDVVMDWSTDKTKAINIPDSPMCNGTNFYDALEWAEKKLHGASGRRGMLVFTDGRESNAARKSIIEDGLRLRRVVPPLEDRAFMNILKGAKESDAPFYFVAVDTDINPGKAYGGPIPDLQQFRARMEMLAKETGGDIVYPKTPAEVVPLFLQIGRELGFSYSLTFTPPRTRDAKPHKFEVRVRGQNDYFVQQSRSTYTTN